MKRRNLKRGLFFLSDRLQISRSERRLILVLLLLLLSTQTLVQLIPERSMHSQDDYEQFLSAVQAKVQEREQIEARRMQRYAGQVPETVTADSELENDPAELSLSVSVNTADAGELTRLPGIGPSYAERIIAYREEHGAFQDINELLKVRGIGEKRLESIRPFVKL